MSTTLTIRNLDEAVKQKLRMHAASHGRSMEAEAREILRRAVEEERPSPPRTVQEMEERLHALAGTWKQTGVKRTTDQIMAELRGDD